MTKFKHEYCLLKHHVRTKGWLPVCKDRLKHVRLVNTNKTNRRLKYFTFCAIGAIDVLMLDVAKVIRPSRKDRFNTVYFFDKSPEDVVETQKRIPGSKGFPGNFVHIVLLDDPADDLLDNELDHLEAPIIDQDEEPIRKNQVILAQRSSFINSFPFDIINLDLEEFVFKPNDQIPGKVINSFRKIFKWQKRPIIIKNRNPEYLDGFSLMFTTQIGPPNISTDYVDMLYNSIENNIDRNNNLLELLRNRTGFDSINLLKDNDFDTFFKIALPKLLANLIMEADWYIDPSRGVDIYEFERESTSGPYKMLHLVMDIKRKSPIREQRAPGIDTQEALKAYDETVFRIFQNSEILVNNDSIDEDDLRENLSHILIRRKKYFPHDDGLEKLI